MSLTYYGLAPRVPPRALVLSIAALAVPVIATLWMSTSLGDYDALLWLLALVPAFLLAYYRGWRGVATALAAGMAALSVTHMAATWQGRDLANGAFLLAVVGVFVAVSLGIGLVSELLKRERELALQRAYDGTLVVNGAGEVEYVTAELARLLGYLPLELVGRKADELLDVRARPRLADWLARAGSGERPGTFELVFMNRNGSERVMEVSGPGAEVAEDGSLVVLRLRDVTDRRRLEEQFRLAQRMEMASRLAGGIAHEFNNILTTVMGHARLLAEDAPPRSAQHRSLESIVAAASRASSLVQQLLAFTRQQVLRPELLEVNHLIRGFEDTLRRISGDAIQLRFDLEPAVGYVQIDPNQFGQVLLTLVTYGRNAMRDGGQLSIRTASTEIDEAFAARFPYPVATGPYVLIEFGDTGAGMDEATRMRIFEPFSDPDPARAGASTGLEFSSAYGIVKQSGGYIWVDSQVGVGTTFTIYLPRVEAAVGKAVLGGEEPVDREGRETVLLVEDDEEVRSLVRMILLRHGYGVLEARDGEHALTVADEYSRPIHLLVTDVIMPRMGGRELAERFAETHPDTRVLIMSGHTDEAIMRRDVFGPDTVFLRKPFSPDELLRKVREALDTEPAGGGAEDVAGKTVEPRTPAPAGAV